MDQAFIIYSFIHIWYFKWEDRSFIRKLFLAPNRCSVLFLWSLLTFCSRQAEMEKRWDQSVVISSANANFGSFYAKSKYFTLIFGMFTQNQSVCTHFLVLIFPRGRSVMVPIFKFFMSGVMWSCCWSCCSLVHCAVLEIAPPIPVVIYIQWFMLFVLRS